MTEGQTIDSGNSIDLAYDTSLIAGGVPVGWGPTCERYLIGSTAPGCYRWRAYTLAEASKSGTRLTFDFILVTTGIVDPEINTIAICKAAHEIDGVTIATLGTGARCFRIFIHNEGTYYRWIFTLGEDADPENIQFAYPLSAPGIVVGQPYRLQVDYDIAGGRSRFLVDDLVVLDVDEVAYLAGTTRRMPKTVAYQINGQSQSSFGGLNSEFLMDNIVWEELNLNRRKKQIRPSIFKPGLAR